MQLLQESFDGTGASTCIIDKGQGRPSSRNESNTERKGSVPPSPFFTINTQGLDKAMAKIKGSEISSCEFDNDKLLPRHALEGQHPIKQESIESGGEMTFKTYEVKTKASSLYLHSKQ